MGDDIWPDGIFWIGQLWDDPEALVGMVDDGYDFIWHRSDGPVFTQEVQSIIGIEAALEVEGQMQIQEGHRWDRAQVVAFFFEGQFPGGVGGQVGGATDLVLVVPVDLDLEQSVGVFIIGDFFISQEGDQAVLQGAEAAFDFAFGLGIGSDAMSHAQRSEGALELGMGVEPVVGGGVAKERQSIGVKAGGRAVLFDHRTKMNKVRPSGIAGGEGAAEDFTGVIVQGQDEVGITFGGPPGMRRTVVLPEFADARALPAPTGFGAAFWSGNQMSEVRSGIGGDGGAGAVKIKLASQFIGQQRKV